MCLSIHPSIHTCSTVATDHQGSTRCHWTRSQTNYIGTTYIPNVYHSFSFPVSAPTKPLCLNPILYSRVCYGRTRFLVDASNFPSSGIIAAWCWRCWHRVALLGARYTAWRQSKLRHGSEARTDPPRTHVRGFRRHLNSAQHVNSYPTGNRAQPVNLFRETCENHTECTTTLCRQCYGRWYL